MNDTEELERYAEMGILLIHLGPKPETPVGDLTYIAGGEVDDASITLRFFGPHLDPDTISQRLGCVPTMARRKGAIVREHWIATTDVWFYSQPRRAESLTAQIQQLFDLLPHDLSIWDELQQFSGELFCRISCRTWNRVLDLSPEVSRQLAQRHVALTLDIYFEPDEPETHLEHTL